MLEEYELLNDELEKRNEELNKEIERLENENERYRIAINEMAINISKAIEYIEKWQKFPHTNGSTHEELRNLKGILKGSAKE